MENIPSFDVLFEEREKMICCFSAKEDKLNNCMSLSKYIYTLNVFRVEVNVYCSARLHTARLQLFDVGQGFRSRSVVAKTWTMTGLHGSHLCLVLSRYWFGMKRKTNFWCVMLVLIRNHIQMDRRWMDDNMCTWYNYVDNVVIIRIKVVLLQFSSPCKSYF